MIIKNLDPFSQVCTLRDYKSKRSSSWDKSGGNEDWQIIEADGGKHTLLDEGGLVASNISTGHLS